MNLSSSLKKNNNPKHYCLALCLRLQCTCQSELSTQNATVLGQAAAEPLTAYLCESQHIVVYLCWFITPFHHLLDHPGSRNMTAVFFFPPSLPPSASFSPLPFHLFSPVASDQTEEKAAKTNKPALSARRWRCQTLASQPSHMWLFATNLSVMLILQIQNRLCLVRSGKMCACFMVPEKE